MSLIEVESVTDRLSLARAHAIFVPDAYSLEVYEMSQIDEKTLAKFAHVQCGALIKTVRVRAGLTQQELARKCKITQGRVSQMENGIGGSEIGLVVAILRACGFRLQLAAVDCSVEQTEYSVTLVPRFKSHR